MLHNLYIYSLLKLRKLIKQAFSFVFHEDSPLRRVEDRQRAMNEWMKSNRYWDHLVLNIKHYAAVPLLLWCLSVFLSESIPSLHSQWWFYPSALCLFSPHSALSPSPFLIFSHFQSIPSPSHSHRSILVQINFPVPISFCRHLSNLITFLSYLSYTKFFLHDFYSCFAFSVSF